MAASASGWKRMPQALPWRKAWCSVAAEEARERAPAGQVEDVAVPMEDGRPPGARPPISGSSGSGTSTLGEADLRPLPRPHLGAEGAGQELGAEADAEHRDLPARPPRRAARAPPPARDGPRRRRRSSGRPSRRCRRRSSIEGSGSPASASTSSTRVTSSPKASRIRCGRSQDACMRASTRGQGTGA